MSVADVKLLLLYFATGVLQLVVVVAMSLLSCYFVVADSSLLRIIDDSWL